MFRVLLASARNRRGRVRGALVSAASVLFHAAVVVLAVTATSGAAAEVSASEPLDTTLVYLRPPVVTPPAPEPAPAVAAPATAPRLPEPAPRPRAERPAPRVAVEKPQGFQTVAPPAEIPDAIPPVDLTEQAFDPRDFTGRGVEGGRADGVPVAAGFGAERVGTGAGAVADAVYRAVDLERVATLRTQPALRYPPALEQAGIEGSVVLEFVVGRDGRVEPSSVKVVSTSHPAFAEAAREVALESRFEPARLDGQAVRQVVRQRYRFAVE